MLPSLSIYLGLPDILSCQHEVDSQLLSNWLSDTLNGIRGQGEIMFPLTKVEVATCESMEAFLYRSELILPVFEVSKSSQNTARKTSNNAFGYDSSKWNFFPELCYTNCIAPSSPSKEATKGPLSIVKNCQSLEHGSAKSFNIQSDSFSEPAVFEALNTSLQLKDFS